MKFGIIFNPITMVKFFSGRPRKDKIISALLTAVLLYKGKPFRAFIGRFRRSKKGTESMVLREVKGMLKLLEK